MRECVVHGGVNDGNNDCPLRENYGLLTGDRHVAAMPCVWRDAEQSYCPEHDIFDCWYAHA